MSAQFKPGQTVAYTCYGGAETSKIVRIGGNGAIIHLANGRWMHAASCKVVSRGQS